MVLTMLVRDIHGSDNVSEQEILAYLGCSVILSVNPIHQLRNVFSSDPYMCNPGIKSVFALKRFQKIGRFQKNWAVSFFVR